MKDICWGIIGCGQVTEQKSGPAFNAVKGSRLSAVMRRNLPKAKDYALRHAVPFATGQAKDIIEHPEINAVYIATPPVHHYEYAIQCLEAGKAVYVEKPMALTYEQCLDMIHVSKKTNQSLFVAYYRRSLEYFITIKKLLEQNAIGRPVAVELQLHKPLSKSDISEPKPWRVLPEISGGGYFFDLACHQIDILNFFFGIPENYSGRAFNYGGAYPAEDTVEGIINYPENIVVKGSWKFCTHKRARKDVCTIRGLNGDIRFSFFGFKPVAIKTSDGTQLLKFNRPAIIQKDFISSIVSELSGKTKCPGSLKSAAITTKIMQTMLKNYYS